MQELKESILEVGQLEPIMMWQPSPSAVSGKHPPVIVDGVVRKEVLDELGIEPEVMWLDSRLSAVEVLAIRIETEMFSKFMTEEDQDAYLAQLAEAGLYRDEIFNQVRTTRLSTEEPTSEPSRELKNSDFKLAVKELDKTCYGPGEGCSIVEARHHREHSCCGG